MLTFKRKLVLVTGAMMLTFAATSASVAQSTVSAPSPAAAAAVSTQFAAPVTVSTLSSIPAPTIAARAWIVIDVVTGQTIASFRPDQQVEPASLTKIMTAYLAFNALEEKRLTLDQQVNVSETAWKTRGSRMFIEPNRPVTVQELLKGIIIQSGNDASVALAEAIAGSEQAFAQLMNEQAKRLGMNDTHYMNATGLPNAQHTTTVQDLAILAQRMIEDHPKEYGYYQMREFTYNKIKQSNRNRLLWADPSVDGMKTGHTDAAGYCLISSAQRGDRRLISVLVGADSEATRAEESLKLLNWSFQNFDQIKLYDANQAAIEARVWQGTAEIAKLGVEKTVWVSVPRGMATQIKPVAKRPDPLLAPLAKGEHVGTLSIMLEDKLLKTVQLDVLEGVERAGFFGRMVDSVKLWMQ
ncbi:MAG: D-alanyl-D-alanine carboxypeptidase [Burkholderiaceae bacterium]|nr:D-alanyl-D-alanine carboxypeptidase [Burkholderiaceae bacterium]